MSTATITADQPALFDPDLAYTEADRVVDRQLCRAYLKQWASSFKCKTVTIEISAVDFNAAAARLAQQPSGLCPPLCAAGAAQAMAATTGKSNSWFPIKD